MARWTIYTQAPGWQLGVLSCNMTNLLAYLEQELNAFTVQIKKNVKSQDIIC